MNVKQQAINPFSRRMLEKLLRRGIASRPEPDRSQQLTQSTTDPFVVVYDADGPVITRSTRTRGLSPGHGSEASAKDGRRPLPVRATSRSFGWRRFAGRRQFSIATLRKFRSESLSGPRQRAITLLGSSGSRVLQLNTARCTQLESAQRKACSRYAFRVYACGLSSLTGNIAPLIGSPLPWPASSP